MARRKAASLRLGNRVYWRTMASDPGTQFDEVFHFLKGSDSTFDSTPAEFSI